jgi:hypothetical protein
MKTWVGVAAALATVASSQSARGAAPPVDLVWDAPAGCPDGASVEAEIARALGSERRGATITARAVVRRDGERGKDRDEGEWTAALTTTRAETGETGERQLRAPTCELLAKATALALALAAARASPPAEPAATPSEAPPPAEPEPAAAPAARSIAPSTAAASDATPTPSAPRARFAVGAGLTVDSATLPHTGAGPSIYFAWRPSRIELEGGLLYLSGKHADLGDRGAATFYLATATARICYVVALAVPIGPCASMDLGALGATSTGPQTISAASWWATPGVSVRARWPKESLLAVSGDVGAGLALSRPEFVLDGVRHVYQTAPVTARGTIGLEARFP